MHSPRNRRCHRLFGTDVLRELRQVNPPGIVVAAGLPLLPLQMVPTDHQLQPASHQRSDCQAKEVDETPEWHTVTQGVGF